MTGRLWIGRARGPCRRPLGVALVALASLTACSGGGTAPPPTASRLAGAQRVTFTMKWTAPQTAARTRAFVPSTARSVSVAVNGGAPFVLNAPATTLALDAPVGTDSFAIATYDAQNAGGSVLSRATVSQAIVAGTANIVAATLDGVVASIALTLASAAPNAGVASTTAVGIAAKDADGNTIVGGADYATPIHLAISDPSNSGTLSLSTSLALSPATTVTLAYTGGTLASGLPGAPLATVVATANGATSGSAAFTPTPTFYTYPLPTTGTIPIGLTAGPDGNVWFTEYPGAIGRITPAGVVTEFALPSAASKPTPVFITPASDGNLWFSEFAGNKIGRITPTGTISEFPTFSGPSGNDQPGGLVDHGDGTIWYVANKTGLVGSIDIATQAQTYVPLNNVNAQPAYIAAGPDFNLYFTEQAANKIGRISSTNTGVSEVALAANTTPEQIVRGADGNLWFCERDSSQIGRLSPASFTVTGEFPTARANANPINLTSGADGAIWYGESAYNRIGRITTDGLHQIDFAIPSTLQIAGLATGPDGAIWFSEASVSTPSTIGKLVY